MGIFGPSRKEKKIAKFMAPQWLRIVNDCATLVNQTTNPEVFFYRYDLMLEHVENLSKIQRIVHFSGTKPSAQLKILIEQRERETDTFLDRAYQAALEHAASLKTPKGKENAMQRFFQSLEPYKERMTVNNVSHLKQLQEKTNI